MRLWVTTQHEIDHSLRFLCMRMVMLCCESHAEDTSARFLLAGITLNTENKQREEVSEPVPVSSSLAFRFHVMVFPLTVRRRP
jgi:hypothetical protein